MKTSFLKVSIIVSILASIGMSSAFAGQCSDGTVATQKAVQDFLANNKGVVITNVAQRAEELEGLAGPKFEIILATAIPSLPDSGIRLMKYLIDKQSCEVTYANALMLNVYNGAQPQ